jgi:ureidoglycolate hydrolase
MWHRRRVSGQRFVDVLSSAPIDIEGFTVKPRAAFIDELTRHVETTQYFIPISGPILSPVAPSCNNDPDQPDPERLVTVRVLPGEAIEIARGAWHTLPFALSVPVACISIVHRLPDGVYHDVRDLPAHGWIGIVNL